MNDLPPFANFVSNFLLFLLLITFVYSLLLKYVSDETLYDLILLQDSDPKKLTYYIEPSPKNGQNIRYKSIFDVSDVYLSLIVPAFNESLRIRAMLNDAIQYLDKRKINDTNFSYEIIVVDDGSKDDTPNIVLKCSVQNNNIRLLRQPKNMGKGAAVQVGCLHARGKYVLTADADGATNISEIDELERKIRQLQIINKEAIVIGSRAHLYRVDGANKALWKRFLSKCFHVMISFTGVTGIQDTQCGFKLFSREACRVIFPNQHIRKWCFDPELLLIGRKKKMEIAEVPVEWYDASGSNIRLFYTLGMMIDIIKIGLFYRLGLWTIRTKFNVHFDAFEL